jgi:hypothetical protein
MSNTASSNTTQTNAEVEATMAEIGYEQIISQQTDGYQIEVYAVLDDMYRIVVEVAPEGNLWTIYHEGEHILDGFGTKHDAFRAFVEAGE